MAKFNIYDYVHPGYGDIFEIWRLGLQKKERAKLDQKIDALALHGMELIPNMAAATREANIFKLRAQGAVKLRPLFCEGPIELGFTMLMGAKEIQWKWEPIGAPQTAAGYRLDIIANPKRIAIRKKEAE